MNTTNQLKIFIVEDNEVYAKSLQGFLQMRFPNNKEIKIFQIGELCLVELNYRPTIVIMDYFLNSKYEEAQNGLEIIKHIKEKESKAEIIVLTAQEKIGVMFEAIEQYGCYYVQKDQDAFRKIEQLINDISYRENTLPAEPWN